MHITTEIMQATEAFSVNPCGPPWLVPSRHSLRCETIFTTHKSEIPFLIPKIMNEKLKRPDTISFSALPEQDRLLLSIQSLKKPSALKFQ